jgi:hypothetical protein
MTQKYIGNGTERRENQNTLYLVCFGYQSPYAGEMFDIFSENDFFIRSIRKVVSRIISFLLLFSMFYLCSFLASP